MVALGLRNPKLFGLDVNAKFADVENKRLALTNINLPPSDLDIIYGTSDYGATRSDWISFSRLHDPLHETLDRYSKDSSTYANLLLERAGTDGSLFGNLKINGSLSGNAIRYRYIEGLGTPTRKISIADISTSRISAWSSSASPILSTSPISYGARLGIIAGGRLKFGTATTSEPRLQTSYVPIEKEFDSEFPTHKIKTTIGGQTVTLYAMKGIPLIFKGFFRNLDATIKLTGLINDTPASWKIIETGNANNFSKYENQGNTTSTINYRSSISRERFIQFYYSADKVSEVDIKSANIRNLPAVRFNFLTRLELSYNGLREFPDLNFIAPNIIELLLRRNPFYLSEFENERKLQNNNFTGGATTGTVLDKIPAGLKRMYLEGTFYGSITQNIIADRFTGLTVFDVGRGGGAYFHPDTADGLYSAGVSTCPNVPNTVETYNVISNDFRSIDAPVAQGGTANGTTRCNVNQLTNLVSLNLASNYYLSDADFGIASGARNKIVSIEISGTGLPFPSGVSGSTSLQSFGGTYGRALGPLVDLPNNLDYVFDNCSALTTLSLYAASLGGALPVFTNINLTYLDLRYTGIVGGDPAGLNQNVIPEDTFQFTTNLSQLYIDSSSLLNDKSIHPNAFINLTSLTSLVYRSYGRTTGPLPSFAGNPNLSSISIYQNGMTGTIPNFSTNQNISSVYLADNKFTGQLPTLRNLSKLDNFYVHNNQLTTIGTFENLPNLRYLYCHNNDIAGEIPDFSECPRLYYLIMFNNELTAYKTGSFKEIYSIRYIDLSNNQLTPVAIDQMLEDLYENWSTVNRGGVTLNIRANSAPTEEGLEYITILRSKGWNITHD